MANLKLRPFKVEDAKPLGILANNEKVSANLRDTFPYPYTEQDALHFICEVAVSAEGIFHAIEVDGEFAGSITVRHFQDVYQKTGEIGYWLGEPFWGKGLMSKAVALISEEAFQKFDLVRIQAEVFARNIPSQKVLEKCGFQLEGTLRKSVYKRAEIMDAKMYALVR